MQGIVFDVKRFSVHDGPGIRQTVFLKGCPLKCWWCHNPESQSLKPEKQLQKLKLGNKTILKQEIIGKNYTVKKIIDTIEKDIMFFEESGGGVTFSGGEPLMQSTFLMEILKECKKKEIHTTIDTCGYTSLKSLEKIIQYTDLFLFDIKHIDDELHKKYTEVEFEPIKKALDFLINKKAEVIIRYPIIPGINNCMNYVSDFIIFLKQYDNAIKEIHVLPYHKIANHKYETMQWEDKMKGTNELNKNEINKIVGLLKNAGYKIKIGG